LVFGAASANQKKKKIFLMCLCSASKLGWCCLWNSSTKNNSTRNELQKRKKEKT
jgi:hypothetical protein